jgi:hypothetical protein
MEQVKELGSLGPIKELSGSVFYDVNYQKDFDSDILINQIMTNINKDFDKLVTNNEFKFHKTLLTRMLVFGVINFYDLFRSNNSTESLNDQLKKIITNHFQHPDIHVRSLFFEIYDFPRDN